MFKQSKMGKEYYQNPSGETTPSKSFIISSNFYFLYESIANSLVFAPKIPPTTPPIKAPNTGMGIAACPIKAPDIEPVIIEPVPIATLPIFNKILKYLLILHLSYQCVVIWFECLRLYY